MLLNVADFVVRGALEEVRLDDWRAQFETNVIGLVAVTQAVLPGMRERHSGHIINASSGGGIVGVPRLATASRAIVTISRDDQAPMRLHLGHGLDSVRHHYRDRLDEWSAHEDLTSTTLATTRGA